jgi:hypothetical protein
MAESTVVGLAAVGSLAVSSFIGFRFRSLLWIVVAFFISVVFGALALEDESGGTGVGILVFFTTLIGYIVGRVARVVYASWSKRRGSKDLRKWREKPPQLTEREWREARLRQDRERARES